jgi:hypothetical protein
MATHTPITYMNLVMTWLIWFPYTIKDSDDIWDYIRSDSKLNELLLENHEKWLAEEGLEIFLLTYTNKDAPSSLYILIEVIRKK